MTMLLRLLLIPSIGLALLSACDPRGEEEASLSPVEDLSATEIIQRILDAERSITSIREERTDISSQLAAPIGDVDTTPQESRELRIQVGDDIYINYDFVEPDLCDGDEACLDSFSPLDETLYYNGQSYYRDRSGHRWVLEPESGCLGTGASVSCLSESLPVEHWLGTDGTGGFVDTGGDCPALASTNWPERIPAYSFNFSWLTNPDRIESGSDDAGLIHLHGIIDEPFWSFGLTPEVEAIYAECGIDPAETFESTEFPEPFKDYLPDRFKGSADIWLDPVTFFVHRIDWSFDSYNLDRVLQSETARSNYSQFNEAELPGPLPQ